MRILTTKARHVALPLILLVCLGLSWAVRLLAIKEASRLGALPIDLAAIAMFAIVVILTLVNMARSKPPPTGLKYLRFYALSGLFGFGAPFLLEFAVALQLPALVFVIIVTSTPIWTVFLATVLRLEPADLLRTVGVATGFVATALVLIGTANWSGSDGFLIKPGWLIASFCTPMLYAVYILFIAAAWPPDLDNLQGAQGQSTIALIAFAAFWLVSPEQSFVPIAYGWPLAAVVLSEMMALLLFHIARSHGGSFASQANYVAVVSGSLLGILLFEHNVNAIAIIGVVLLVVALRFSAKAPVIETQQDK